MKRLTTLLLVSLLFVSSGLFAQKDFCRKFHSAPDCKQWPGKKFKYYSQSRSITIGVGDEYLFSLVLYKEMQYKMYFCTSEMLLPVHFQVLNTDMDEVIYDNINHEYLSNLTLNMDHTQRLQVKVEILADEMTDEEKKEFFGCLAMMIYERKEN